MEIRHARWQCPKCQQLLDLPIEQYHGQQVREDDAPSDDLLISELQKPDSEFAPRCNHHDCQSQAMLFEAFLHEKK